MVTVIRSTVRRRTLAVERETLASQLVGKLRLAISTSEIPPGTRLTEHAIAAQAGVSRSTVREALRTLARDGLVSLVPMSGARVVVLSHADIEELTEVRCAIEVFAARKLVASNDDAKMATIQAKLHDLGSAAESGVWSNIVDADVRFHRSIVEATANGRLLHFWREVEGQLLLFLSLYAEDVYQINELAREHALLVDAILSRDHETVARAFESHIRSRVDLREELWSGKPVGPLSNDEEKAARHKRAPSKRHG